MGRESKPQVVGGMFGLGEMRYLRTSPPSFLGDLAVFLVNASSGIWLLIRTLSPSQVWMPSYLCDSMLKAVDNGATTVKFYEMNYDLMIPSLEWIEDVGPGDLIVFIDYFGFPGDTSFVGPAKERGAWILEDASQALLSNVGQFSDFVLFSPRKFLGVPDGGVLVVDQKTKFNSITLDSPPATWCLKTLAASILRRDFDLYGGTYRWFELFQETEAEFPIGPYAMSELSKMLLWHSFDYLMISERRVANYQQLSKALGTIALSPSLPAEVVPLGFPIRLNERDRVRRGLFARDVYPSVHWPIQGVVPERFKDSHRLAAEIMTLPCDQRYDNSDMDRMAQIICDVLGGF